MFTPATFAAATAFLSTLASASPIAPRWVSQGPFNLTATNSGSINSQLVAGHVGAGEEGLNYLPEYTTGSQFVFNQTGDLGPAPSGYSSPGYLQFTDTTGNVQLMSLYNNNSTANTEPCVFGFGDPTPVVFQDNTRTMAIFAGAGTTAGTTTKMYLCPTDFTGDTYTTLSYLESGSSPTDGDCEAVTVTMTY